MSEMDVADNENDCSNNLLLLDRVFLRLGNADTDDQLESCLARFLPPVILKLSSAHEQVRTKVMELLVHVNKRVKCRADVQLPVQTLLQLYKDPKANSFIINFTIIYITMGFPRQPREQQLALVPALLEAIENKPQGHQDGVLVLIMPLLGDIKEADLNLKEKPKLSSLILKFATDILLLPYRALPNTGDSDFQVPPGMSMRTYKRIVDKNQLNPNQLEEMKLSIVNLISKDIFNTNDVLLPLVVAAADSRFSVANHANSPLIRANSSVDWSTPSVVAPLYSLYLGTWGGLKVPPDDRKVPACTRLRLKIIQYLNKATGAGIMFPHCVQVIFSSLFDPNTNSRLRNMALMFLLNVINGATAWATYCWPDQDWSSVKSLSDLYERSKVLCGRHFEDSCYIDSCRKRLSRYAVPGKKQYVIKTLHSLRSKISISSIVQQEIPAQDPPVAGCSADPVTQLDRAVTVDAEPSNLMTCLTVNPSQDFAIAGCSTDLGLGTSVGRVVTPPVGIAAELATVVEPVEPKKTLKTKKKRNGILKYINKTKLKELTETERKLYGICKKNINGLNRLRKTIKSKAKVDKIINICEDSCVKRLFDLKLNNSFILMLQSHLINFRRKRQGRRYNLDQKLLALTLFKKSPACYRLIRQIFSLPCPSTLNKLLNHIPMKPGINHHVFDGLKAMAETFTEDDNLCTLVFDEMAIRKHLNYNPKTDSVDGFQDHANHGRTNQIACHALVFMVCGLRKRWKQPIAFYLSGKSGTSDRLYVIIKEVLTACFQIGLNVVATICDMCSVNLKALRSLGTTTETPCFSHDGREIVTIADPPHLLKCLRNMFMAHDIEFPTDVQSNGNTINGTAKWEHIKQFYALDKLNPQFVYAPALTDKHINPNAKQKMRVKFAAQIFSHTVTAGILAKVATNELPAEALATATLLKKVDDLFDALNANSPDLKRGKKYSTNLTSRSPHLKYFAEMKNFIRKMKFLRAKSPPSQSGWIQTITAVERLWKNLTELGIQTLSTRRLNQDPLENFFGCVRYNSGSNYNPTISQFVAGFKTAIITNLKNSAKNKNCEDDDAILCNNLKSFFLAPDGQTEIQTEDISVEEIDENISDMTDSAEDIEMGSEIQACAYVCGFIIKKLSTSCDRCIGFLTSNPGSELAHVFTEFKEYNETKRSLNYASHNLVMAVEKIASVCKSFFTDNLHIEKLRENTMRLLKTECRQNLSFLQQCPEHFENNFNDILFHVFTITLKRYIVLKNRDLSEEASKKALQRKISILQNK